MAGTITSGKILDGSTRGRARYRDAAAGVTRSAFSRRSMRGGGSMS